MEDVAVYADRLLVVDGGKIVFDDAPRKVFSHVSELEKMGLAVPQVTYIMKELSEMGLPVDREAITVAEGRDSILKVLKELEGGRNG